MTPVSVLLILAAAWLGFLVVERILLGRHRAAIPLRIAVTGTRGKTTVTRLLAGVLRESGQRVLAKSTGSEAAYVLPDGSLQPLRRRGVPSIIEQKRLLRVGASLGVDAVVAEIMSVHRENHLVEAREILHPHLVLATNFRVDHMDALGTTREAVARTLALDVPPGAQALVPAEEWEAAFQEEVGKGGGVVKSIPSGEAPSAGAWGAFGSNLDLVWAAARELGVAEDAILRGIESAQGDLGELRAWWYGMASEPHLLVNAFAANDPVSTFLIHDRVCRIKGVSANTSAGLLCLRADRGDRTLQWAEALASGGLDRFRRLFVAGFHAQALRHRLRRVRGIEKVEVLRPTHPSRIMKVILGEGGPHLLFGFGNIKGLGEEMVSHWQSVGEPHGV